MALVAAAEFSGIFPGKSYFDISLGGSIFANALNGGKLHSSCRLCYRGNCMTKRGFYKK
jgi:hypothetical protein